MTSNKASCTSSLRPAAAPQTTRPRRTHVRNLFIYYKWLSGSRKALVAFQADYLTEYAEWLISSGQNDGETAEDVLLSAADALLEFDVGDGGCGRGGACPGRREISLD